MQHIPQTPTYPNSRVGKLQKQIKNEMHYILRLICRFLITYINNRGHLVLNNTKASGKIIGRKVVVPYS
jgi:hypothetical protein